MIFYLAALQSMSPHLAEAAAIEGASRWYFFRRVTFPLLMPTTLFVLVNAVINAFRLVDHVVVMTRGGPDNATSLLLYYIYEIGFRFWDSAYAAALTMVLLAILGLAALVQFGVARAQGALPMTPTSIEARGFARGARDRRRLAAGHPVDAAARLRVLDGVPPARILDAVSSLTAPLTLDNFVKAWAAAPFARYFVNTVLLVTMVLAAQLVLVTLAAYAFARFEFPGRDVAVRAGAGPADGHARRADRRELPDDGAARTQGHDRRDRACRTWPAPSASSCCARRSRPCRASSTRRRASRAAGRSRVLWKVYVPLARPIYLAYALVSVSYHWNNFLWPLIITNSVESRPLTVGSAGVLGDRPGDRLVDHHRGDAADDGAAADRVPAVPAAVRPILHEGRHSMKLDHLEHAVVLRHRRPRRSGADRRRGEAPRRLRRAVPAGDRRQLSRSRGSRAAPARTSSRRSRRCCPGTWRSQRDRRRPSGGRRPAAPCSAT